MSKIMHDRPALRRRGKALEAAAGEAPAGSSSFRAQMYARRRDAENKAELSRVVAEFLARRGPAKK